ncbi:MFS transporter [Luteimonas lutimaris]|uniref:MFS transporter n=1 Tax=Luteimonas lutimaris TaxID=698645 RepID=A0ABP7MSF2_9GAMM
MSAADIERLEYRDKGWRALVSGRTRLVSLALCAGVALHAVNLYVSTTILPSVVQDIGGLEYYAWNTTMFVAASILGATLSSRLLADVGPRGAYALGSGAFAVGSAACALAPTMAMMLAGRSIQGLGGGLLLALAFALVRRVYPEPVWSRAMALLSSTWGMATLLGPAAGGVFAEMGNWRAAFGSIAIAALLLPVLAARALPRHEAVLRSARGDNLPWPQLVLLLAAVVAVSWGSLPGSVMQTLGGLASAAILVHAIVRLEVRSPCRVLPQGVFSRCSPIGQLYGLSVLMAATVTCTEIFLPLFLQDLKGFSPLAAGYVAALMSAGWTLAAIASASLRGHWLDRAVRLGPFLSLASLIALMGALPMPPESELAGAVTLCALVASGMGVGLAYPHFCARIMQVATHEQADQASASIMTVQLCATAFGAALAGLVVNLAGGVGDTGVFNAGNAARWLFAVIALAPIACIGVMWKGWR